MAFYSPLKVEQFRLLHLAPSQNADEVLCTLCPYSVQDAPGYTALSYTWTDPHLLSPEAIPTIVINDIVVRVGSNLASALLQLRRSGHTTVWADAICINQNDLRERSFQVSLMSRIYRQAFNVFVWLGRAISGPDMEHDLTHVAFEFLDDVLEIEAVFPLDPGSRIASYCFKVQLSPSYNIVISALRALLGLDYWRRAWILQEMSVNDNVDIVWGERSLGWRKFKTVFIYLAVNQQYQPLKTFVLDVEPMDRSSPVAFERLRVLETLSGYRRSSLQYNLAIARTTKQTDPRDALYAKLGLSYDGNQIVPSPDYSASIGKVYSSFARSFVETKQSLYVICMSYPEMTKLELPSWVPDWSHAAPRKQLVDEIRGDTYQLYFRATAGSELRVSFGNDGRTIWVEGFHYQAVPGLECMNTDMEMPHSAGNVRTVVDSFMRASIAAHYLQYDTYDAYEIIDVMVERIAEAASLLLADPSYLSSTCHSRHQQSMLRFETWFAGVRNIQLGRSTLLQWLTLYTIPNEITPQYLRGESTSEQLIHLLERFVNSAKVMGTGRRVVMLPNELIALVPVESISGDRLCLLFGCPVPMILRAVGKSYVVVGECYVDGVMHGEAMSSLLQGANERTTFCIE